MNLENVIAPYGYAVVRLLKGPVEHTDTKIWEAILNYQSDIQKYLSHIGLVPRQQLGFEISVILIILRQMLEEFDSNLDELYATERFVSADELKERIELFLPERFNRVKLLNEIDAYLNRIVNLGFLKVVKRDNVNLYQIHRVIKEKVTLDQLQDFKNKLQEYVESV